MTIKAGARIRATDRPAAVQAEDQSSVANITSTSFITGTPVVETTFTAPPSGTVLVFVGGGTRDNSGAGNKVSLDYEIYQGTSAAGTLKKSANEQLSGYIGQSGLIGGTAGTGLDFHYFSRGTLVTGLTAGATHYARLLYKVNAGNTCDISDRQLIIIPT